MPNRAPKVATQGPWSPLPEGEEMVTYRADVERGDQTFDKHSHPEPAGVPGEIRVEKCFDAKSEQR